MFFNYKTCMRKNIWVGICFLPKFVRKFTVYSIDFNRVIKLFVYSRSNEISEMIIFFDMVATMILADFFTGLLHFFDIYIYGNFQLVSESDKSTSIEITWVCMDSEDYLFGCDIGLGFPISLLRIDWAGSCLSFVFWRQWPTLIPKLDCTLICLFA
jgi:hypothetical protein